LTGWLIDSVASVCFKNWGFAGKAVDQIFE